MSRFVLFNSDSITVFPFPLATWSTKSVEQKLVGIFCNGSGVVCTFCQINNMSNDRNIDQFYLTRPTLESRLLGPSSGGTVV